MCRQGRQGRKMGGMGGTIRGKVYRCPPGEDVGDKGKNDNKDDGEV